MASVVLCIVLTFNWVWLPVRIGVAVPITRPLLTLYFLMESPVGVLVEYSFAQILVVVENRGTYCLLCPVLAHNELVDTSFQI